MYGRKQTANSTRSVYWSAKEKVIPENDSDRRL